MWISVVDIINFHGLKPKHLNLEKDDVAELTRIVGDWIVQCQSLIEMYTNRTFTDDTVPAAVQNVCLRLTSNMVTLAIQKRDSPIIKVNDWTIKSLSSDIFTDDLKNDLKPFKVDKSNVSDKIDFFAITGG